MFGYTMGIVDWVACGAFALLVLLWVVWLVLGYRSYRLRQEMEHSRVRRAIAELGWTVASESSLTRLELAAMRRRILTMMDTLKRNGEKTNGKD